MARSLLRSRLVAERRPDDVAAGGVSGIPVILSWLGVAGTVWADHLPRLRLVSGMIIMLAGVLFAIGWRLRYGRPHTLVSCVRSGTPLLIACVGLLLLWTSGVPVSTSPSTPIPAAPFSGEKGCFGDVFNDVRASSRIVNLLLTGVDQRLGAPAADPRSLDGPYAILFVRHDDPTVVGAVHVTYDTGSDQIHVDELVKSQCQQITSQVTAFVKENQPALLHLPIGTISFLFWTVHKDGMFILHAKANFSLSNEMTVRSRQARLNPTVFGEAGWPRSRLLSALEEELRRDVSPVLVVHASGGAGLLSALLPDRSDGFEGVSRSRDR
jgi:hypothetical protein